MRVQEARIAAVVVLCLPMRLYAAVFRLAREGNAGSISTLPQQVLAWRVEQDGYLLGTQRRMHHRVHRVRDIVLVAPHFRPEVIGLDAGVVFQAAQKSASSSAPSSQSAGSLSSQTYPQIQTA